MRVTTFMNLVAALILISSNYITIVRAESDCGYLEERLLYNTKTEAEPTEYVWMGLLLDLRGAKQELSPSARRINCNVIIVSGQHVLVPNSCLKRFNNQPASIGVLLGIWNQKHNSSEEFICNDKGFCVFAPVPYQVTEIKVNPLADKDTGDNDVALLKLAEPIKMTIYAKPICLLARNELPSLTDRNFQYGGFEGLGSLKGKGDGLVVSRNLCNGVPAAPPENQFCAFPEKRTPFYLGTALMGLNIENDVPRSFYLIGMLMRITTYKTGLTTFVFQDMRKSRNWILENISTLE
ncbi:inactive serine protease PAMR1-like [Scaptodrosophila lebanonensis]|uniref:Inactive serine protease PAMR1-like n=1 Tax=Drosophila lebanonensis TaxID=7225 RepID=A0A6J2T4B2_DROLE|nr:inactive serine protease PAMR1-like [Scaptodrosophila lebanonensis]